jgi:3-isopropylmalate/(R)-2-methylmalate dehydratase large subunit
VARTLFEKLWERHEVTPETGETPGVLYIDLHLVHEVTSPQAFTMLRERGMAVRRPDLTFATMDHSTPTLPLDKTGEVPYFTPQAKKQVEFLRQNCADFGIPLLDIAGRENGVVHVVAPEAGRTRPGMTIVCGDSHTSTHGAFGALAFGIGTTEVGHVLATQCLLQRKPKTMRVTVDGELPEGVGAKDIILAIIAEIGVDGGTGSVIEYAGSAIRGLSMEERMTVCNMSIEAGARAGIIAPDEVTFDWLRSRIDASDAEWAEMVEGWKELCSDEGATFDREVHIDAAALKPMVTYGTAPDAGVAVDGTVPEPHNASQQLALDYMKFKAGAPVQGAKVNNVFIGSCTNGRLPDLRVAAKVLQGRKVSDGVRMLVVPGSWEVRKAAEAEGLDQIFLEAGAEWRLPGCSMCIAMNGDFTAPGELTVSTSNRNFEGRQGKDARTVLASPATAAASAVEGVIADPRPYLEH